MTFLIYVLIGLLIGITVVYKGWYNGNYITGSDIFFLFFVIVGWPLYIAIVAWCAIEDYWNKPIIRGRNK